MNVKVIQVPPDSCTFQIFAKIIDETPDAWIIVHKSIFIRLMSTEPDFDSEDPGYYSLKWKMSKDYPKHSIKLMQLNPDWFFVTKIKVPDTTFISSTEPVGIILLKTAK